MQTFHVANFGPIEEVEVTWGDLTFLIGEQASGKSLFLELLKLQQDREAIIETLRQYNFVLPEGAPERLLDLYFGEGLSGLWTEQTRVELDGVPLQRSELLKSGASRSVPLSGLCYVPAQRILCLDDGRPRSFMEFNPSVTPYVLRDFSEMLRLFLQVGVNEDKCLYPRDNRLKEFIREELDRTLFRQGKLLLDEQGGLQRLMLAVDELRLPFLSWSAGQKEFMPLLLATYCLTGPPVSILHSQSYHTIIVEEPEMGLHASAVRSILLQLLDLVNQGKRVIVSTHSPIFLEFAWAFQHVHTSPEAAKLLCKLFDLPYTRPIPKFFQQLVGRSVSTYLFHRPGGRGRVVSQDISRLDAFSDQAGEEDWGGLSAFAERAAQVVAELA